MADSESTAKPLPVYWLTTSPNPRSSATGFNAGQRGWRQHAVRAKLGAKFSELRGRPAACGILPRHGWSLDLFIEERCARCVKAVGEGAEEATW